MPFLTFYVTYPDEITARQISQLMVKQRLAACANVFPIASIYWWEGVMQTGDEWVSVLKTSTHLEWELEKAITQAHPYEVPCLLRFEVRANQAYEQWIKESVIDPNE